MFQRAFIVIGAVCILIGAAQPSYAEGRLREIIKERIAERRNSTNGEEGSFSTSTKITKSGDYQFTIEQNNIKRSYLVHVPTGYQPSKPTPLVFAFHGGGGDMDYMASDRYGIKSKADKSGFIVVFPNGYSQFKSGKFATWNAGKCCGNARDKNVDDIGFVRAVINNLSRQMNIDNQRIFAMGMSNGGMMSYKIACELPDVFKAIASVAGTDNTVSCNPNSPISVMHIHAKDDNHVLFEGGVGEGAFEDRSKITDFTSVNDTITKWIHINECQGSAERVKSVSGAYCDLHKNCRDGVKVQLCVTETGGHSWPGGTKKRAKNPPSQAISANDEIWKFFENQ